MGFWEKRAEKKRIAEAIDDENARLNGRCDRCQKGLQDRGMAIDSHEGSIIVRGIYCPKCAYKIRKSQQ